MISRPILDVASHLEIVPCVTYAASCLWNFTIVPGGSDDLTDPDNLSNVISFTGTKDEEWFFMVSVAIEAKGAPMIRLMLDAIDTVQHAKKDGADQVVDYLRDFSNRLQDIQHCLERMGEKCGPDLFFNRLRPLLAGSKNMADCGLPSGVFYDLGEGHGGMWRQYYGASNGQSSLIQAFDIFLGVEHSATGGVKSSPSAASGYLKVSIYISSYAVLLIGPF